MRLRGRLLLSFAYLLMLAVVALAVPLGVNVQRRARADLEAEVAAQALVIAATLLDLVTGPQPRRTLQPVVESYADDVEARVIVVGADGALLADSDDPELPRRQDYSNRPEIARALGGERVLHIRFSNDLGTRLLVVAVPVFRGADVVGVVRLSEATTDVDRRIRVSWLAIGLAGAFVVAAGLAIAYWLARSLSRPLQGMHETATALASGDLSARAPEEGPDDVAEVARALNRMAAHVEATISSQRDFVANASHQLRTPLTGLRLRLEAIERAGGPRAADAAAAIDEVDRLNGLVEDLLRLARARGGGGTPVAIDLPSAVHDAADRWTPRVAGRGQTLEVDAGSGSIVADRDEIAMALDSLIENAVSYSSGPRIRIVGGADDRGSFLGVIDDGPGISAEDLSRVRERFYRGGVGRQAGPGTGLGLAIVEELVGRWGGRLDLDSDASGTRATIIFTNP